MIPNPIHGMTAVFEVPVPNDATRTRTFKMQVLGFDERTGSPMVLTGPPNPSLIAVERMMNKVDGLNGYRLEYPTATGAPSPAESPDDVVAYLPGGEAVEFDIDGKRVAGIPSGWTVHRDGSVRPLSVLTPATTKRTIERDPQGEISGVTEEIA